VASSFVGEDRQDDYSRVIKNTIFEYGLHQNVHLLGTRSDTADILDHVTVGVLSSVSEGLPVALLEYGLAGLAVVSTNVGQCAEVLGEGRYGELVPSSDAMALGQALRRLSEDHLLREAYACTFQERVKKNTP